MNRYFGLFLLGLAIGAAPGPAQGSVVYLYDFPGNPGSGLASNQTNSQPAGATFSDFTMTSGLGVAAGSNGVFGTNNWNQTGSIDTTQYVGFTITAASNMVLDLSSLTFNVYKNPTGPVNGEVALFLNGSTTPYATFNFSPTTSSSPLTFNFTALMNSDNVTSAAFSFYGWNSGGGGGSLFLDNVATNGTIAAVPESRALFPLVFLLVACAVLELARTQFRKAGVSHPRPPR